MEDIQFQDAESYMGASKEKISFREIVLWHVKRIGEYASVEFRGGYWEEKPHPNIHTNLTIKTYIPDSREVYSNAIEYLFDILYPHFDEKMIEAGEKVEKEMEEAYKTFTVEEDREDKNYEEGKKADRVFSKISDRMSYRTERAKINRKLFRGLCCFLYRKKYLELRQIED